MKKYLLLFSAVIIFAASCSKSDSDGLITLTTPDELSIYYGDDYQIVAESNAPITYVSDDEYYAEVSSTGLITAGFVGSTKIKLTNGDDSKTINLTVKPTTTLYDESDFCHWGYSESKITSIFGSPDSISSSGMYLYSDYSTKVKYLTFSFELSQLCATLALVSSSYTSSLTTHLSERYKVVYYDDDSGSFMFVNTDDVDDVTTYVLLDLYSIYYWGVGYFDAEYLDSTKSSDSMEYKEIYEKLRGRMHTNFEVE